MSRILFDIRLVLLLLAGTAAAQPADFHEISPGVNYARIVQPEIPWSIHVVKFDYARPDLRLVTTHAQGIICALGTLEEQIQAIPPEEGEPLAGINGDFFLIGKDPYQGEPNGLQIMNGELLSSPNRNSSLWMDKHERPRMGTVQPRLLVTWPDGQKIPVLVNRERTLMTAALLTPTLGSSTRTSNGVELVLEHLSGPWLPLRPNQIYSARVREVHEGGNTPLVPDEMVLSLGPALASHLSPLQPGVKLKISTGFSPDLAGVEIAVSGGPPLVSKGRSLQHELPGAPDHLHERNPRTAVGWNDRQFFLVVVDGRKKDLSVGMTLPELAKEMIGLGCTEAINLDGGGSTTMWVEGKVVNHPSDEHLRGLSNALILLRKK